MRKPATSPARRPFPRGFRLPDGPLDDLVQGFPLAIQYNDLCEFYRMLARLETLALVDSL
ncbi:MAG: hypothetical protein PHX61_02590 [Alphaproteobacteria bacterium]|nr:hypothetical protein [Alphaproteobacteria bacterium]